MYKDRPDDSANERTLEETNPKGTGLLRRSMFSQDYCAALDNSSVPIYIIDPETFEILFCNKTLQSYLRRDPAGLPCYKVMMGTDAPLRQMPGHAAVPGGG